jgi:hypothetical protein
MKPILKRFVIVAVAIILAAISIYFIKGWFNVIPWALAAIFLGYLSPARKETIINGALFGYFLFLVYIILGYAGKTDTGSLIKFILFALLFSLIGSLAGIIGTLVGNFVKRKLKPN